jgi:hypothetical protein
VSASYHDHGVVLFDAERGELFSANLTGAEIWQALEQQLSSEHIASALSERYRIPLETADAHTTNFLAQLERRRLVMRRAA